MKVVSRKVQQVIFNNTKNAFYKRVWEGEVISTWQDKFYNASKYIEDDDLQLLLQSLQEEFHSDSIEVQKFEIICRKIE